MGYDSVKQENRSILLCTFAVLILGQKYTMFDTNTSKDNTDWTKKWYIIKTTTRTLKRKKLPFLETVRNYAKFDAISKTWHFNTIDGQKMNL